MPYNSAEIGPGYSISGIAETYAMLDQFPKVVMIGGVVKALEAAAKIFEAEITPNIPIRLSETPGGDLLVEGGNLQAALMHVINLDNNYRGGFLSVGFGRLGYIANFLEYGHRMIGHKPDKKQLSGPKTPGGMVAPSRSFMRTPFMTAQQAATDAIAKSLAQTVDEFSDAQPKAAVA